MYITCVPVNLPIDHHRDPLPGSEGSHTLQLLVCDPYWNQELLRVTGAQPVDRKDDRHDATGGGLNAVHNAALYSHITVASDKSILMRKTRQNSTLMCSKHILRSETNVLVFRVTAASLTLSSSRQQMTMCYCPSPSVSGLS